jgi:hypothetical protein
MGESVGALLAMTGTPGIVGGSEREEGIDARGRQ